MRTHEVVIIGAGPAGIMAAIQLKRSGISPVLLEKEQVGGLLLNANLVENYPGFPEGVTGEEFVKLMVRHLEYTGIEVEFGEVKTLSYGSELFLIGEGNGTLSARRVVVASGTRAIIPDDIPFSPSLLGCKIFSEVKDVPLSNGCKVAVVGGGDCAFDYALNLVSKGCEVSILHRGDRPKALKLLVDRVEKWFDADYIPGVVIKEISKGETGLRLHIVKNVERILEVDFLLLAVGREPQDSFLSHEIREDLESGREIEGLYFAGDVRRGFMRQSGIAVGDGLMAAMDICSTLGAKR
jgi:thioredoxin reductase